MSVAFWFSHSLCLIGPQSLAERCVTITRNVLLLAVSVFLILALKSYGSLLREEGVGTMLGQGNSAFEAENNLQDR